MDAGFHCDETPKSAGDTRTRPNLISQPAELYPAIIDLCCGLGGLSLAARQLGMTIVAGVDTDRDALRTFAQNFPNASSVEMTVTGRNVVRESRAALDSRRAVEAPLVILSGPPCQGFSVAGSRNPRDKRNKVLLGVARTIVALRPLCALVENVQMLLAPKYRARVRRFEKILKDACYHVLAIQLDARDYGVPQTRQRAFFLITSERLHANLVAKRFEELREPEVPCCNRLDDLPPALPRNDVYTDELDAVQKYPNHFAMRHSRKVQLKIARIRPGSGPMSYRKLDPSRPANTLFSGHRAPPSHYAYHRSITVREAARLQGFPDDFRIYGSFGNQMLQVTNAVPPPLARIVLKVLAEFTGLPHKRDA